MTLYVITGPPCSCKSTWVAERAIPGDIVVDLDRIALAITAETTCHHEYPAHIRRVAMALRKQLVSAALMHSRRGTSYVIHSKPSIKVRAAYYRAGAVWITLNVPTEVLLERASRERPKWIAQLIQQWAIDEANETLDTL